MNEQPIALWLADQLRKGDPWVKDEAATELCRLHALNDTLEVCASMQFDELNAVKALNAELLKALNAMLTEMGMDEDQWNKHTFNQARDAIAKAQGESNE